MEDSLLREADKTAKRMGLSRSRLFALAVGDFLERQRRDQMLSQLNEVYADRTDPAEGMLLKSVKAKSRRTLRDTW
jgi:metal-responsive CopG/Arc/MetJ family transcriptional regulator